MKFLLPFVILLFFVSSIFSQKHNLNYKVVHKNNKIGWIKIQKTDSAGQSSIVLNSEISKRIIFLLSVIEKQEVTFDNSGMTRSFIYRKVNNDVKMNRRTSFKGSYYEVKDQGSLQKVMLSRIRYNLLSMYYTEPVNISAVYSDTFQRYLAIEAKGNASYKVALPDGNNNYYFYTNGVCSRIIVEHSLFSVEFIRV
jgi:hypothetical protein